MGSRYEVDGWTFGDRLAIGREEWYYAEIYRGQSLLVALWHGIFARRHYGCVRLKLR